MAAAAAWPQLDTPSLGVPRRDCRERRFVVGFDAGDSVEDALWRFLQPFDDRDQNVARSGGDGGGPGRARVQTGTCGSIPAAISSHSWRVLRTKAHPLFPAMADSSPSNRTRRDGPTCTSCPSPDPTRGPRSRSTAAPRPAGTAVDGGSSSRAARRSWSWPWRRPPHLRVGTPHALLEGAQSWSHGFDAAPGGKRFLMISTASLTRPAELRVILNWFDELERLVPHPRHQ
jgi:hypothetical protein